MRDRHNHACTRCGNAWSHEELPFHENTMAAHEAMHTCDNCGKLCIVKYNDSMVEGIAAACEAGHDGKAYIAAVRPEMLLAAAMQKISL